MSGGIDDLNFDINADISAALSSVRTLDGQLQGILKSADTTSAALRLTDATRGIEVAQVRVANLTKLANDLNFNLQLTAQGFGAAAIAAQPLALLVPPVNSLVVGLSAAGSSAHVLGGAFGAAAGGLKYLYIGTGIVLAPLRGLLLLPKLIAVAFHATLATLLLPFRALGAAIWFVFNALKMLAAPFIAIAAAVFRFKLAMSALSVQFKLLHAFVALLPPKLRLLVGGLVLLGATGRVGAAALRIAAAAARGLMIVSTAIVNPLKALRMILLDTAFAAARLTLAAVRATVALIRMTGAGIVSGVKTAAGAVASLAASIGGKLVSVARAAASGLAMVFAGAAVWGLKSAMTIEKNNVVFGVMLKDMAQGKAVVDSLNASKAAKLFDNDELLNSGRLLFKAGVSAADLAGKTDQLATIAAATSTELNDLARIYQQGANVGSFGQDHINQLAERGIDIYHALEAATGKSGGALKDMISSGGIGIAQMDAALAHLTEGQGIYAGALEAVGNTTAGMLQTIKANLGQALGAMMGSANTTVGTLLQSVVELTERMKTDFAAVAPVVVQVIGAITDAFGLLWTGVSAVWTAIFGAGASTFSGLLELGMSWATSFRWFFQNFGTIAQFAFAQFKLFGVTAFNDFIFFFTDKLPAYLNWFAGNWKQVFTDAGNLIVTVFSNIATNIGNAMRAIWDYIKSGGTAELKFAFVPLLDGFEATVSQLPDVPARAMTQLESELTAQTQQLGTTLANDFDAMLQKANESLTITAQPKIELKDVKGNTGETTGDASAAAGEVASRKAVENKAALVRSSEGQSVAAQFALGIKPKDTEKRAAAAAEKSEKHLADLVREQRRGKPLVARAF